MIFYYLRVFEQKFCRGRKLYKVLLVGSSPGLMYILFRIQSDIIIIWVLIKILKAQPNEKLIQIRIRVPCLNTK